MIVGNTASTTPAEKEAAWYTKFRVKTIRDSWKRMQQAFKQEQATGGETLVRYELYEKMDEIFGVLLTITPLYVITSVGQRVIDNRRVAPAAVARRPSDAAND
ncbi:unnamed protein product [Mucor hiemalis]